MTIFTITKCPRCQSSLSNYLNKEGDVLDEWFCCNVCPKFNNIKCDPDEYHWFYINYSTERFIVNTDKYSYSWHNNDSIIAFGSDPSKDEVYVDVDTLSLFDNLYLLTNEEINATIEKFLIFS
jgi:hypothetical protein